MTQMWGERASTYVCALDHAGGTTYCCSRAASMRDHLSLAHNLPAAMVPDDSPALTSAAPRTGFLAALFRGRRH